MNHSVAPGVGGASAIIWIFRITQKNQLSESNPDSLWIDWLFLWGKWQHSQGSRSSQGSSHFLTLNCNISSNVWVITHHNFSFYNQPDFPSPVSQWGDVYFFSLWDSLDEVCCNSSEPETSAAKKWVQRLNQALSLVLKSNLFGSNLQGFKTLSL